MEKIFQKRGRKMYQNYYPQQMAKQQPQMIIQPPQGLKGRPVSSIDEVRAASIDFDGSVSFFPDLGNGKIYTKQIGLDGTAVLNMYELAKIPMSPPTLDSQNYVTREEFEKVIAKLMPVEEQTPEYNF